MADSEAFCESRGRAATNRLRAEQGAPDEG